MKRSCLMLAVFSLFLFAQVAQADWMATKRLTWNAGFSFAPDIAVDPSGNPHVIWNDDLPGNYEIYYKKSSNGGATWTSSQRLTWNSGSSYGPAIAVDTLGHLHLCWSDYTPGSGEIYYKRSTDGGGTWTKGQRLTWNSGNSSGPAIVVDSSDNLHLFWYDFTPGNEEIYYKRSTDGGDSWSPNKRLTWTLGSCWGSDFIIDSSGNLHMAWCEYIDLSQSDIYYEKSTDGGTTWTPGKKITWTAARSLEPAIAADVADGLHLVWREATQSNLEIYYKKSTDGGNTWTTGQRLTWTSGNSVSPDIGIDSSSQLHVVWPCQLPGVGFPQIYYKKSLDEGSTWTSDQRLSWVSALASAPDIVVDVYNNLHIVWYGTTSDNSEIYYKKYIK